MNKHAHLAGFIGALATFVVFGLFVRGLRRSLRAQIWWLFDLPPRAIGEFLGYLLFATLPFAAVPIGIVVYRIVMPAPKHEATWVRTALASATSWFIGFTAFMILYRANHWLAFTLLERAKD
ncbi:MAG: hypothetical protein KIS96_14515 [Bauldia sp.]|nr:hypothetical protein [Bauldia sp.]